MQPLFTVQSTVTAQFDHIFSDREEELVSEESVEVPTGPDFTQRFAKALITQRGLMAETCKPTVKQGPTSLEEWLMRLSTFCLVDDAEKYSDDKEYGNIMVSKAEFLQYVVQLENLHTENEIDLYEYQEWDMPYGDVKQDRWYTPYVYTAFDKGLLDNIGQWNMFSKRLQPLWPVSWDELRIILENAGHDLPHSLPTKLGWTEYVTKSWMIRFLNVIYDSKLSSADIMYGNNTVFYEWIIKRTMKKTPAEQESFVQEFIDGFRLLPAWKMDKKYTIQSEALTDLLESLLTE